MSDDTQCVAIKNSTRRDTADWREAIITLREALVSKMYEDVSTDKSMAYATVFRQYHILLQSRYQRPHSFPWIWSRNLCVWRGSSTLIWRHEGLKNVLQPPHPLWFLLMFSHPPCEKTLHLVANSMLPSFSFPPLISVTFSEISVS